MEKILFVCHGNICRSPMAEMMLKHKVQQLGIASQYEIDSVATSTEEIGNDLYPPAKQCLRRHQIPFTRHSARQMTLHDYAYYDRIFVMDTNNLRYLHWDMPQVIKDAGHGQYYDPQGKIQLLMSLVGKTRDVADPWYTGDFERTYEDIEEALNAFLQQKRC